jgi:signal transduction histidine kinase
VIESRAGGSTILVRIALLLAAWCVVVLFSVSQLVATYTAAGNPAYWGTTFRFTALQWVPWLVLAPLVIAFAQRVRLNRDRLSRSLAAHVAAALAVTVIAVVASYGIRSLAGAPIKRPFSAEFLRSVHSTVFVYALIVGATHAADAWQRSRRHEQQVARLETQLAEARLAALQSQLQPHFLFNTLHGISSLIHDDPDGAEDMLTALSDLLRMALGRGDQREVPLRDDLGFLERYLEIHKMRLGERLSVTVSVPEDATDLLVPSFALQPLVENAIRHAIAPRREGGRLEIRAERVGRDLRLVVADNGQGVGDLANSATWGLGLSNTRARLEQLYGDDQKLSLTHAPGGGLVVEMTIPARAADPAAVE